VIERQRFRALTPARGRTQIAACDPFVAGAAFD